MSADRPKILLSEGSSLSSREAITALGLAGHRVELLSSDPLCLGRFSRFVRRVHRAPASGADPDGYLARVIETVEAGRIAGDRQRGGRAGARAPGEAPVTTWRCLGGGIPAIPPGVRQD